MKLPSVLLALALVSCATLPATSSRGKECYRYVNTLDFGKNNTLDPVSVIGYDESGELEATRFDVTVGTAGISLHDFYNGTAAGAMYNPAVELKPDGALIVSWGRIGEEKCRVEIVADATGKLVERKRTVR